MDDPTAIRNCLGGEPEAFRCLVERYQAEAIGHALSILGNREDALDAVQEAFIDAYRTLKRFDLSRKFYPWFYIILRHCCFKLAAGRAKRETSQTDELLIMAPTPGIRPEETMLLEKAMLDLNDEDRELIAMRHLDGLSYEELANRLEVPMGTIMSRLYHARKRLREKLARVSFTGLGGD